MHGAKTTFIYLHGFNSGGASAKAEALRKSLDPIPVLAPTYPAHRAAEAVHFLRNYIKDGRRLHDSRLVLIGSSLGGHYARYLARPLGAAMVLINPAMTPETDLLSCIGYNHNPATGEEYTLSAADVQAFGSLRQDRCDPGVPTLVLLDEGDELLDYRIAREFYSECARVIVYPGGSHRFEHLSEATGEIRRLHETGRN